MLLRSSSLNPSGFSSNREARPRRSAGLAPVLALRPTSEPRDEFDDGYNPLGLGLVFGKSGVAGACSAKTASRSGAPTLTASRMSSRAHLYGHVGMSQQVVVPVWVGDDLAVPVTHFVAPSVACQGTLSRGRCNGVLDWLRADDLRDLQSVPNECDALAVPVGSDLDIAGAFRAVPGNGAGSGGESLARALEQAGASSFLASVGFRGETGETRSLLVEGKHVLAVGVSSTGRPGQLAAATGRHTSGDDLRKAGAAIARAGAQLRW